MQTIRRAKDWICDWSVKPDFKQIVDKSLTLFGVFTGVTLSFYIKDFLFVDKVPPGFTEFPLWSRALIVIAVTTLLLRYIIGSAVHLNVRYVPAVNDVFRQKSEDGGMEFAIEERKLKSESIGLLFFDVLVLLVFGIFAVAITYALDFEELMWRSFYFMMVGVVWGVIAAGMEIATWPSVGSLSMCFSLRLRFCLSTFPCRRLQRRSSSRSSLSFAFFSIFVWFRAHRRRLLPAVAHNRLVHTSCSCRVAGPPDRPEGLPAEVGLV
jgi:hypothetical protein